MKFNAHVCVVCERYKKRYRNMKLSEEIGGDLT